MKKLIALLLCLALCLPVLASAETAEAAPTLTPTDFVYFTIGIGESDLYQIADAREDSAVYAMVYPNFDPTSVTADNFNVVWMSVDPSASIKLLGAEMYAKMVLSSAKTQYESMGIVSTNEQVLSAEFEDGECIIITSSDLDYTGAGVELAVTQYQMQCYFCLGEGGTWLFTFTATSLEALEAMTVYLDTLEFADI